MTPSVFDPELAAIAVARTALSDIDADAGELHVGGYAIEELAANATYEEAVHLLFEGRLPTDEELREFRADLAHRRSLPEGVDALLREAVRTETPVMEALRMGMAAATLDEPTDDPAEQARRAVAVLPTIVARYWRYRQGEQPVSPRGSLSHAANYLYMLTGEEPDDAAVAGLEAFLVTCIDHGLNTSTFAARTVVSTESDPVSGATAAIGALKGPRHGEFERLLDVFEDVADGDVEARVRELAASDGGVPGFSHPRYRVRDPRASVLSVAAERLADARAVEHFDTARAHESAATDVLADRSEGRPPIPTMELYTPVLLRGVGVPRELLTATFAVSRVGGWMAHCLEQLADNSLVRPHSQYVGPSEREWTPRADRHVVGDALFQQPAGAGALEPISDTLATLSEPSRLEILLALSNADGPVTYSELREATSITDKGRFNYHLRQLRGYFVDDGADGYRLTDAGRTVVETVVTDDRFQRVGEGN